MSLAGWILRRMHWTVDITVPDYPKVIICVAPHTSNWDFIMGKLAYASVGRRAGFLMKDTWFFFPLGLLLKAIGGVPVPRGAGRRPRAPQSITDTLIERYRTAERLAIAITPEGTRSATDRWHTGFLNIARGADVPIVLGVIDYALRKVIITRTFTPTGDNEADIRAIKAYYKNFTGRHPEKFLAN